MWLAEQVFASKEENEGQYSMQLVNKLKINRLKLIGILIA
jgi:hypothetical protein